MALALFQGAQERATDNVHTPIYVVIEQAAFKVFFTGSANELFDQKMYKLAKYQNIKQDLVRHLIKTSTFTVLTTPFVKQKAVRTVPSEKKFRQ